MNNQTNYIKNKITGEIRTVRTRCSDDTMEVVDSLGNTERMIAKHCGSVPPLGWEYTEYNYEDLAPYLVNFFKTSKIGRYMFDVFARRIDNDYYKPGVVVHVIDPYYLTAVNRDPWYYNNSSHYVIKGVRSDLYQDGKCIMELVPKKKDATMTWEEMSEAPVSLEIPFYPDHITEHDIFMALKRFDKPY